MLWPGAARGLRHCDLLLPPSPIFRFADERCYFTVPSLPCGVDFGQDLDNRNVGALLLSRFYRHTESVAGWLSVTAERLDRACITREMPAGLALLAMLPLRPCAETATQYLDISTRAIVRDHRIAVGDLAFDATQGLASLVQLLSSQ